MEKFSVKEILRRSRFKAILDVRMSRFHLKFFLFVPCYFKEGIFNLRNLITERIAEAQLCKLPWLIIASILDTSKVNSSF